MDFDFDNEALELLKATLKNGIFFLLCYAGLWLLLSKSITNKKAKAITIGLITPFFFYYSVGSLAYPLMLLLYIAEIDPIGITFSLIIVLLIPLSLLSGILVASYLLKNK
ncbi:MAG: hypothetical protein ACRC2R_24955 [Xenococcaceae cyanobacterium]